MVGKIVSGFIFLSLSCSVMLQTLTGAERLDWPQWRGPDRTGISKETGLLKEWPKEGPKVLWKIENLGPAYSAVTVARGRIFTQGTKDGDEAIFALDLKTGETLWAVSPNGGTPPFEEKRGNGARGSSTILGDDVYTEGGTGIVTCLDFESGKQKWSRDFVKEFDTEVPKWGYCESPLIDGDKLIVTPGGAEGAIVALNRMTGETLWSSKEVTDPAHYSSPILAVVDGVPQYIQFLSTRVVGVAAADGKFLWDYAGSANKTANVCTPIIQDHSVFTSSAYGTGGGLVELEKTGDTFKAEEKYFDKSMANHHGGIILYDGFLYGFGGEALICMNFKTGEIAWKNRSVGKGSLTYADGHFYCLGEKQVLGLVEANPKEYIEKGQIELPESGRPSWAHPVVAQGRLFIRDQGTLTCYDISEAGIQASLGR